MKNNNILIQAVDLSREWGYPIHPINAHSLHRRLPQTCTNLHTAPT